MLSCSGNNKSATAKYTCFMHPTGIQDRPFLCPVWKMDLTKQNLI
ncbi:MAG: heavy metal-binding domain-containing protein [Chitinophagaceae bacterium]